MVFRKHNYMYNEKKDLLLVKYRPFIKKYEYIQHLELYILFFNGNNKKHYKKCK